MSGRGWVRSRERRVHRALVGRQVDLGHCEIWESADSCKQDWQQWYSCLRKASSRAGSGGGWLRQWGP